MSDLYELLAEQRFFEGMSGDQIRAIADTATRVSYREGETLFVEGGRADSCLLILDGSVALELQTPGHGSQVILTLHAGDLLGWSWLYPPYRWSYDAHARCDTTGIRFDGPQLIAVADSDPVLGYELMKRITESIVNRLQSIRIQLLDVYSTHR